MMLLFLLLLGLRWFLEQFLVPGTVPRRNVLPAGLTPGYIPAKLPFLYGSKEIIFWYIFTVFILEYLFNAVQDHITDKTVPTLIASHCIGDHLQLCRLV